MSQNAVTVKAPLTSNWRRFSHRLKTILGLSLLGFVACLDPLGERATVPRIEPTTATILRGDTVRLVFLSGPEGEDIQNPTDIQWSSDPRVAVVNSQGLVTGVATGRTIVEGVLGKDKAYGTVNVVLARTSSISPRTATLLPGTTTRLILTVTDPVLSLGQRDAAWSSSSPSIASVDSIGAVTAHRFGSAEIAAQLEATTAYAHVVVSPVIVVPATTSVIEGDTTRVRAIVATDAGDTIPGASVKWSIDDSLIATIDSSGLIHAWKLGLTSARAELTNASASATISVVPLILVGAGDIADCLLTGDEETAALVDTIPGQVFTAGDNAYPDGRAVEFANCYAPSWGRFKNRTHPSPGNHEYFTQGAVPYFSYFGAAAGDSGKGYYSYELGAWHIISLNSQIDMSPTSPQAIWLKQDLAEHQAHCVLAYWHYPLFSSGMFAVDSVRPLWQILYDNDADVIISGHDHHYERFFPQTPAGVADSLRGIRQFIVGTGGRTLQPLLGSAPNSEIADNSSYGVLKLTLHMSSYDWEFVPVAGKTFRDSGSGTCH